MVRYYRKKYYRMGSGRGKTRVNRQMTLKALSFIIAGLVMIGVSNSVVEGVGKINLYSYNSSWPCGKAQANCTQVNWFGQTTSDFLTTILPVMGVLMIAGPIIWVIRKGIM